MPESPKILCAPAVGKNPVGLCVPFVGLTPKWMLWNDGVEMADLGMTRVRIGLFQHALAHPDANSVRFESIEAKLDELRSYLYANRESVMGIRRSVPEWRAYFDRACGVHRQSIDQLAHVQEATNGDGAGAKPSTCFT